MPIEQTSFRLAKIWKGYLSGTNRGSVIVKIEQKGRTLQGKAIFQDEVYGPAIISLSGDLNGAQATLRLAHFHDLASSTPSTPLDGQIILNFDEHFHAAEGTWNTDIGTYGTCKVQSIQIWILGWWLNLAWINLKFFFIRNAPALYSIFLLGIAILNLLQILQVSSYSFLLLLIPAPYIFRAHLSELIRAFGIRRIGPVELQSPPTLHDIRLMSQLVEQVAQDVLIFDRLDKFFVLRTKSILNWLAKDQTMDRARFNAYAIAIGVPKDNLDVTWNALIFSGCAKLSEANKLEITDLGRRYVTYLQRPLS